MSRFSEKRLADDLAVALEEHNSKRRRRDVATIAITFLGGLVVNFVFSKAAIAFFCWLLTVWAIADYICTFGSLWQLQGTRRYGLQAVIAFVLLAIGSTFLYNQYCIQHAALNSGVLEAPSHWEVGKEPKYPILQIGFGEGCVDFVWNGNSHESVMQILQKDSFVRIEKGNGQFELSTLVRDRQGNVVLEVKNNRWTVAPTVWDKNYTDNAIEVKDSRGRVVFHALLLPDRVEMEGEWNDQFGKGVRWMKARGGKPGALAEEWVNSKQAESMDNDFIQPAFLYPSSDHWGEFSSNQMLKHITNH